MTRTGSAPTRAVTRPPLQRVLFDLHGVLLGHARPPPGVPAGEVISRLRRGGVAVAFVTNSSSSSAPDIVRMLAEAGIEAQPEEAVSAGRAMALYLREHHRSARLLLMGQPGLRQLIEEAAAEPVRWTSAGDDAEVVVVGRAPQLAERELEEAARAGRRGALLLATSDDARFLMRGDLLPGPGQTVRQVEQAMGARARIIGKPDPFILLRGLGLTPQQLQASLVVGDSSIDVRLGACAGAATALFNAPVDSGGPAPDWRIDRLEQVLELVGRVP
jgi:HAD superfamily hydrolase (TIGR01450 family)